MRPHASDWTRYTHTRPTEQASLQEQLVRTHVHPRDCIDTIKARTVGQAHMNTWPRSIKHHRTAPPLHGQLVCKCTRTTNRAVHVRPDEPGECASDPTKDLPLQSQVLGIARPYVPAQHAKIMARGDPACPGPSSPSLDTFWTGPPTSPAWR